MTSFKDMLVIQVIWLTLVMTGR